MSKGFVSIADRQKRQQQAVDDRRNALASAVKNAREAVAKCERAKARGDGVLSAGLEGARHALSQALEEQLDHEEHENILRQQGAIS